MLTASVALDNDRRCRSVGNAVPNFVMGAAAAIVLAKERRLMEDFVRAGATSPDRAVTPEQLGVDTAGIGWRRLRDHAIVREAVAGSGRYYLDVEVRDAVHRTRLRILLVLVAILVALIVSGVIASVAR
jgi:hypothetical protein